MSHLVLYSIISTLFAVVDLVLSGFSFSKKKEKGIYLGITLIYCAFVNSSYMFAVSCHSMLAMKIAYSVYFTSIDALLVFLMIFTFYYSGNKMNKGFLAVFFLASTYLAVDVLLFTLNIFDNVGLNVVDFVYDTDFSVYKFKMYPLYYIHLIYDYILILISLLLLGKKIISVAFLYKRFYLYSAIGIIAVVILNLIYLFISKKGIFGGILYRYDVSILLYTIIGVVLYWNCFDYSRNGYINHLKKYIFESLGQYIVVFDDEDFLLYANEKAIETFSDYVFDEKCSITDFIRYCNIGRTEKDRFDKQNFTVFKNDDDIYRCTCIPVLNKKNRVIATIFTFEKALVNKDVLTGLDMVQNIKSILKDQLIPENFPIAIAVCDLNGLHNININYGSSIGDKAILKLLDVIRDVLPNDTYLFRGSEASIIAILLKKTKTEMHNYFKEVQNRITKIDDLGCFLSVQFSTAQTVDCANIENRIESTLKAMKNKKLLDGNSLHSETMTSLLKTLEECDSDTEAHVKRTQKLGERLGKILRLTDSQLSDLALLCVLHDIGKIAVPLDILNKPGKLTEDEWKVIKSHVVKGYQIVNSSLNISHIANMVLHHHERWDGKGYPSGLKGEEIPILSRIISIVDAYDAMVSDRPYRKGTSVENALIELTNNSGTQFDPNIVNVFVEMIKENEHVSIDSSKIISEKNEKNNVVNPPIINESIFPVKYSKYTLDNDGYIIEIDDNFEKITGYSKKDIEMLHLTQNDLMYKEDLANYMMIVSNQLAASEVAYIEHRIRTKDGFTRYLLCFGKKRYDSANKREVSDITITNISESHLFKNNLRETVSRGKQNIDNWNAKYHLDSVTGLLTFDAFKDEIHTKLTNLNCRYMLALLDIDNFKNYDEAYGYNKGEDVLAELGNAIASRLGTYEIAGRVAADKFVVLLSFDLNSSDEEVKSKVKLFRDNLDVALSNVEGGSSISLVAKKIRYEDDFITTYGKMYVAFRKLKDKNKDKKISEIL